MMKIINFFIIIFFISGCNEDYSKKQIEIPSTITNWNINDDINLPNELVREGKTVFIDITADWCLTCKVNKFFVIDTKEITELFKKNNVNVLRLDWTKPNEKIKQFLAKKGRYGIPFNEIYSPLIPNGKIFPELLTLKVIKEYLDIAK